MLAGIPTIIGEDLHTVAYGFEEKGDGAAVLVTESVSAKIINKYGNPVGAGFQERSYIDDVIIAAARFRTAFEPTVGNHHLTIDPQPVLGICGNFGFELLRNLCDIDILSECHPGIGSAGAICPGNPSG